MKEFCPWFYCPGRYPGRSHVGCRLRRWWQRIDWKDPERWIR
jgi:hypothetical protein